MSWESFAMIGGVVVLLLLGRRFGLLGARGS
jgi:hypothetical protein